MGRTIAAALLCIAAWLRYRFIFDWSPPSTNVFSDMRGFVDRAQDLLDGSFSGYHTLYPPGQHLLLALSGILFDGRDALVCWTHLAAGVLTCYWVWRASARWLGPESCLLVLAISAFHVPFIGLAGYYLAETIFTAWLALLFFLLSKWRFPWRSREALAIGLVAGAGTLWKGTNQMFGAIAVAWVLGWVVTTRAGGAPSARLPPWRTWAAGAGLIAGCLAVLLAQGVYFRSLYGSFLPIAAGGAYNFTLGKCPGATIVAKDGATFRSPRTVYTGEAGVQTYDALLFEQGFFWRRGLECIEEDPAVLLRSLRDVYYLFSGNLLWPLNVSPFARLSAAYQRWFSVFLIPGTLLGILALARRPFGARVLPFLLVPSACASAYLFLGEVRFRIPFDVAFIPLAVLGWSGAVARAADWTRRRYTRPGRSARVEGTAISADRHRSMPAVRGGLARLPASVRPMSR